MFVVPEECSTPVSVIVFANGLTEISEDDLGEFVFQPASEEYIGRFDVSVHDADPAWIAGFFGVVDRVLDSAL